MIYDEIKSGESQNIEFKRELPEKSEKYIKHWQPSPIPPAAD